LTTSSSNLVFFQNIILKAGLSVLSALCKLQITRIQFPGQFNMAALFTIATQIISQIIKFTIQKNHEKQQSKIKQTKIKANNLKMISFQRQKLIPDTKMIILTHIESKSGKQTNRETDREKRQT